MKLPVLLIVVALSAGCLDFTRGEGEESLLIRNAKAEPVRAILRIEDLYSGVPVFSQDLTLAPQAQNEFALAIRPGTYLIQIDTTSSVNERLTFDIPEHGDTLVELAFTAEGARLSVRGR